MERDLALLVYGTVISLVISIWSMISYGRYQRFSDIRYRITNALLHHGLKGNDWAYNLHLIRAELFVLGHNSFQIFQLKSDFERIINLQVVGGLTSIGYANGLAHYNKVQEAIAKFQSFAPNWWVILFGRTAGIKITNIIRSSKKSLRNMSQTVALYYSRSVLLKKRIVATVNRIANFYLFISLANFSTFSLASSLLRDGVVLPTGETCPDF